MRRVVHCVTCAYSGLEMERIAKRKDSLRYNEARQAHHLPGLACRVLLRHRNGGDRWRCGTGQGERAGAARACQYSSSDRRSVLHGDGPAGEDVSVPGRPRSDGDVATGHEPDVPRLGAIDENDSALQEQGAGVDEIGIHLEDEHGVRVVLGIEGGGPTGGPTEVCIVINAGGEGTAAQLIRRDQTIGICLVASLVPGDIQIIRDRTCRLAIVERIGGPVDRPIDGQSRGGRIGLVQTGLRGCAGAARGVRTGGEREQGDVAIHHGDAGRRQSCARGEPEGDGQSQVDGERRADDGGGGESPDVIRRQARSARGALGAGTDHGGEDVGGEIGGGRERRRQARVGHRPRDGRGSLLQGEGRRGDAGRVHRLAERRVHRPRHADVRRRVDGVRRRYRWRAGRSGAAWSIRIRELHQLLSASAKREEEQRHDDIVSQGAHRRPPSFKMMKWTTNSTRRLASRPDSVELDSIGREELNPFETSLSRATPWLATYSSTDSARRFESDWLWSSVPSDEACPSMATRKPWLSCNAFATSLRAGYETGSMTLSFQANWIFSFSSSLSGLTMIFS